MRTRKKHATKLSPGVDSPEQALRQSEEQLRVAAMAAEIGMWSWTPGTNHVVVSANWRQLFGVSDEAPVTFETWSGVLHPEDRERAVRELQAASEEHREFNVDYRVVRPDGSVRWIIDRGRAWYDEQGRAVGMAGVNVDITERKRAEEAVRRSEAGYRSLFQNMLDGFAHCRMLFDEQGRPQDFIYLQVNDAFERLTGLKDVVGRKVTEVIPGIREAHPELFEVYARVAATGHPEKLELEFKPLGIWLSLSVYSPASGDFVAVFDNITDRKKAQAQLEHVVAERTAKLQELVGELEHFSYSITHDMRAPLRAMKAFGDVVVNDLCASCPHEEPKGFLRRIMTSADRMDSLIRDALNYNRAVRQELPLELVDTGALLRGMLNTYPELQPSRAHIQIDGELPLVMGNEAGLTQCFSNLLGNAVKFVKPSNVPEIRVWAQQLQTVQSPPNSLHSGTGAASSDHSTAPGSWVRLWVEDKGIGIPKTMLQRVFDMFSRGHNDYEGTGIGLALVRKVVDRMGGKVGVESQEGQGSRFWIDLRAGD